MAKKQMGCLASVLCRRCSEVKGEGYAPGICHRPDLSGVKSEIQLHVSGDPAKTSLETSLEVEKSIGADLLLMSTHGFTAMFHCLVRNLKHSPQCLFCTVFGLNICALCSSTEISRVPPTYPRPGGSGVFPPPPLPPPSFQLLPNSTGKGGNTGAAYPT